ncbi:hypothetical protein IQ06DRAFT_248744 [Phaeosphaeriaceae sp. SRC1lsM3a]|nr:hypothetical protein IQ06DRAFT_248744 [Stagonospora sp. SRC1lsM3a]
MKLLHSAALFAVMFLTHRVSAGTIGQRTEETLYRGTCNTGTMLCSFQRDETMGDSCECPSVAPCQGDGNACFYRENEGVRYPCTCS